MTILHQGFCEHRVGSYRGLFWFTLRTPVSLPSSFFALETPRWVSATHVQCGAPDGVSTRVLSQLHCKDLCSPFVSILSLSSHSPGLHNTKCTSSQHARGQHAQCGERQATRRRTFTNVCDPGLFMGFQTRLWGHLPSRRALRIRRLPGFALQSMQQLCRSQMPPPLRQYLGEVAPVFGVSLV